MGITLLWRFLHNLPQTKLDLALGQGHALEMAVDEVPIIIGQLLAGAACVEVIAKGAKNERLKLDCGNAAD
jgi:hypothetical protein